MPRRAIGWHQLHEQQRAVGRDRGEQVEQHTVSVNRLRQPGALGDLQHGYVDGDRGATQQFQSRADVANSVDQPGWWRFRGVGHGGNSSEAGRPLLWWCQWPLDCLLVAILSGFAPWIVYWVLVGNVPFKVAVLAALAIAVLTFVIGRRNGVAARTLELGAIATFVVLTVLTFTLSQDFMVRWLQPLSSAGILLVALTSVLIGKPFVREFAEVDQPSEVVKSELFGRTTTLVTWIWVGAFAGMTVSSAIPPIVQGDATILDTTAPLSFVCYWLVPFLLLGLAVLTSRILTDRMVAEANNPNTVRRTTFVAFKELGIDELLYLAQEKANREVGPGKQAFAVQVGGMGTPLTGDESRESWPASYKVRGAR